MYGPQDHEECHGCGATLIATPHCPNCEPEEAALHNKQPESIDDDDDDDDDDYDPAWESERRLRMMEGWG